ncbi:MAG: hypothetical protein PHW92_03865 [Lutibacter sp.]|nr:hypothetical protein [Lutibacter sp.]
MIEQDYLMRFINTFFDSINQIINGISRDDIENVKIQISHSYKLLGNESSFFIDEDFEEIFKLFKTKDGDYLKRVQMLSELMYYDSLIQKNIEIKNNILKKSIYLLEYYIENTKEFSFEINNRLTTMKNELNSFSQ